MPTITYIEANGTEHVIEAPVGQSVMDVAVQHAVPGIDADCGGSCACATCHVYVDPAWRETITAPAEVEQSMLEVANEATSDSRLSCQIRVTDALDGLIVRMPKSQR